VRYYNLLRIISLEIKMGATIIKYHQEGNSVADDRYGRHKEGIGNRSQKQQNRETICIIWTKGGEPGLAIFSEERRINVYRTDRI
jgi:hypothetical protein